MGCRRHLDRLKQLVSACIPELHRAILAAGYYNLGVWRDVEGCDLLRVRLKCVNTLPGSQVPHLDVGIDCT